MGMVLPSEIECISRQGEKRILFFRRCGTEDLSRIMVLQELVVEKLPDPELFARTSREEIGESLDMDVCIGAFDTEKLVMFGLMITGRVTPRNLGTLFFYDQDKLCGTVTIDSMFVDPKYRGFGLQDLGLRILEKEARDFCAREVLLTVSPENIHSLRNLNANGFLAAARRKMYGGLDRLICRKKLD